jgi:hypothetical protein
VENISHLLWINTIKRVGFCKEFILMSTGAHFPCNLGIRRTESCSHITTTFVFSESFDVYILLYLITGIPLNNFKYYCI